MASDNWEAWEVPRREQEQNYHRERFPLMRTVQYELSAPIEGEVAAQDRGKALSVNISSGGLCLLMDRAPSVHQVMRVHVPMPVMMAKTPTLGEVRWLLRVPFDWNEGYLVGLKFLL